MPTDVLHRLGGAASWRRLRAEGVGWYALWLCLRQGTVVRLRKGAYALPDAENAVSLAVQAGGVLACSSAAVALGLPVLITAAEVHLIVPRRWSHVSLKGVKIHRRDLQPDEKDGHTTGLLRTVLDCARELPLREALVICDGALRQGLDHDRLATAAASARGTGAAAVRRVVALADARCESLLESCLRLLLVDLRVSVRSQVWISGVGRVDFLLDGWLVVEADGFEHHSTRQHYREDRRRNNALVAAGYVVVRFSYEDVVHRPEYVTETLRRILERGRP